MANVQKQGNPKAGGVMLIILGVILMALSVILFIGDSDYIFNGARSLDDMLEDGSLRSGEYAEVKVDATFGAYAETKHTINGIIPAGKEQHYMLWVGDNALISLTIKNKKSIDKLEEIVDQTEAYVMGTSTSLSKSITLSGRVKEMSSELSKLYKDGLRYLGADSSNADIYYLDIDATESQSALVMRYIMILAFGIFCIVGAVLCFKSAKKQKEKMAAVQAMQAQAQPQYQQPQEFNNNYYDPNNMQ